MLGMRRFLYTVLVILFVVGLMLVPAVNAEEAAKPKFDPGGWLKVDGYFIRGGVNSLDAPRWAVDDDDTNGAVDTFTGTVQRSRFWLGYGDLRLSDKVTSNFYAEIDLGNLGDIPDSSKYNSNQIRFRQLYADLTFPSHSWRIGQAWDIFSPLNPTTFNNGGNFWFGGNAGHRRPQVRWTSGSDQSETSRFTGQLSVNANLAMTDGQNSGEDYGFPVLMGRLAYGFAGGGEKKATVGMSGVWGKEEVDGLVDDADQYALGLDLDLPISDKVSLKGEIQSGKNTDTYMFGEGINLTTGNEISGTGAWGQILYRIDERFLFTGYLGIDDIDGGELNNGDREGNTVIAANIRYDFLKVCAVGFEYEHFDTQYKGISDKTADLFWFTFIYDL